MSLINDALKRANEADNHRPADPPITVGLKPVEGGSPKGSVFASIFVLLVALGILTGAVWFIWRAFNPPPPPALVANVAKPGTLTVSPSAVTPASVVPVASTAPAGKPATSSPTPTVTAAPVAAPEPAMPAVVPATAPLAAATSTNPPPPVLQTPPPSPAVWPELRVQAVFYRLNNPSVRINGRTLYLNQEIDGARVVSVQRDGAELSYRGDTKTIKIGQKP